MKYENLAEVANAISNLQYGVITTNIVALFLAIIGIYFFTRLKKSAELKEINNNFSMLLKQQKELTETTETIRHSLDKESIYYQVRLNAYHDKCVQSITDIYESIITVRNISNELSFNSSTESNQRFYKTLSEFRLVFDTKKIWLPKELSEHIESVAKEIDDRSLKFIRANYKLERLHPSEDQLNKLIKDQEDFYDYIHQEVVNIFNELADRITKVVSA